jgi:hypothetical protein
MSDPDTTAAKGAGISYPMVNDRQLKAPWAVAVSGIAFAVLFTVALLLVRTQDSTNLVIGGLYLAPFAGLMFIWFIGVIRDQIGVHEDKFFATILFGSGLLFSAILFVAAAVVSTPTFLVEFMGDTEPTADQLDLLHGFGYTLLFALATRPAALFMWVTAAIGMRSGLFPRWLVFLGYALGAVLMFFVTAADGFMLVLPIWVAVTSVLILHRERAAR